MDKVIISAPFGNYLDYDDCTSTFGTFTLAYRGGFAYRIWRCMRTLRYSRITGGWVNKLGLPNPGIDSFIEENKHLHGRSGGIVSLHGFNNEEWVKLSEIAATNLWPWAFELNVSCPNVTDAKVNNYKNLFLSIKRAFNEAKNDALLIVKIPPVNYRPIVDGAIEAGIYSFHACNTLPCKSGGMSGPILKQFVHGAIQYIKSEITKPLIIAGGGVRSIADAKEYINAGANHIAIGSALLNPFNIHLPTEIAKALKV